METIVTEVLSILESPYQTQKIQEKLGYGMGFTLQLRTLRIHEQDEDRARFYENGTVIELGVGCDWWSLENQTVYSKPYRRDLWRACGLRVVSPVYRGETGEENEIMISTSPERSLLRLYVKGYEEKLNKKGVRMKTSEGAPFLKVRRPLIESAWCPAEAGAIEAPQEVIPLVQNQPIAA